MSEMPRSKVTAMLAASPRPKRRSSAEATAFSRSLLASVRASRVTWTSLMSPVMSLFSTSTQT